MKKSACVLLAMAAALAMTPGASAGPIPIFDYSLSTSTMSTSFVISGMSVPYDVFQVSQLGNSGVYNILNIAGNFSDTTVGFSGPISFVTGAGNFGAAGTVPVTPVAALPSYNVQAGIQYDDVYYYTPGGSPDYNSVFDEYGYLFTVNSSYYVDIRGAQAPANPADGNAAVDVEVYNAAGFELDNQIVDLNYYPAVNSEAIGADGYFTGSAIPEPPPLLLLATGLLGVGLVLLRKAKPSGQVLHL
jgi:hypothetical protein